MRAEQKAAFTARHQVGDDFFAMNAHVEPRVLIIEKKNTVKNSRGKAMVVTKSLGETRLALEHFAQILFRRRACFA